MLFKRSWMLWFLYVLFMNNGENVFVIVVFLIVVNSCFVVGFLFIKNKFFNFSSISETYSMRILRFLLVSFFKFVGILFIVSVCLFLLENIIDCICIKLMIFLCLFFNLIGICIVVVLSFSLSRVCARIFYGFVFVWLYLFMKYNFGMLYCCICLFIVIDCDCILFIEYRTSIASFSTRSARSISMVKFMCFGVLMMLILFFFYW